MTIELVLFGSEDIDSIPAMARLYVNWDTKKAHFINGVKAKELAEEDKIKVTFKQINDWRGWAEKEGLEIDETDIGSKLKKREKDDKPPKRTK